MKTKKQSVSHTPGPWEAFVDDEGTWEVVLQDAESLTVLKLEDSAELSQEANARLIAAAPELLEASEILNSELHDYMMKHEKVFDDGILDAILSLRAAIAKAERGK